MIKRAYFLLLIIALSTIQCSCAKIANARYRNAISPHDLEDEIVEQLAELRAVVRGAISKGYSEIDVVIRELLVERTNTLNNADISISEEYETLNQALNQAKDFAASSGQDIGSCLEFREDLFHTLPRQITSTVDQCIPNREIQNLQNDSRYRIDTLINEVNVFDFQIARCGGEILCLLPIVTEMELAMVQVPQYVDAELVVVRATGDVLKVLISECEGGKVAEYVREGTALLKAISDCIDESFP